MNIPVALISQYGSIIGTVFFDSSTNKFKDTNIIVDRQLPVQDYLNCSINNDKMCTIVGKNEKSQEYVVCFGDNFLYSVGKEILRNYVISNVKVDSLGRIRCIDKIDNLQDWFNDTKIKFQSLGKFEQGSSIGMARKFLAKYNNSTVIVKFSKNGKNTDIFNEKTYYDAATLLGVKCCRVILSEYYLKPCCISVYEYDRDKDIFQSFKNTNKPISEIVKSFSKNDLDEFNKMLILDYLLNQQDRHMSNFALVNNRLYPLFDNGECLSIGAINNFSSNYRKYVENLNKNYIKSLIDADKISRLDRLTYYDKEICLSIIRSNIKELGAWS